MIPKLNASRLPLLSKSAKPTRALLLSLSGSRLGLDCYSLSLYVFAAKEDSFREKEKPDKTPMVFLESPRANRSHFQSWRLQNKRSSSLTRKSLLLKK